jgi:hypothetical protein
MPFSKKEDILILIAGIFFLILIGICSWFNRFAVDDYYYISNIRNLGAWGNMLNDYCHWGGRWAVNLAWSPLYIFSNTSWALALSSFLLMLIFFTSLYICIQRLLNFFTSINNKKLSFILAFFLTQFIFFITPEKGEVFFWTASTYTYFLSLSCFLIAIGMILTEDKLKITVSAIIIFCLVYAGGASEAFALNYIIFLLMLYYFIQRTKKIHSLTFKKIIRKRIFFFSGFLVISFLVSALSPGNSARMKVLPEPGIVSGLILSIKSIYHLGIRHFIPSLHYIILFTIPWMYTGSFIRNNKRSLSFSKALHFILISFSIMLFISVILVYPSCYSLSDIAPDRALLQLTMLWTIYFILLGLSIGYYKLFSTLILKRLFLFFLIVCSMNSLLTIFIEYPEVSRYAKSLDQRKEFLMNLEESGNKKTIILSELPPSGYLYSSEITKDSLHYKNLHFKKGLELDFYIILGEK